MYQEVEQELLSNPRAWLITGVAGFIGSNILERLLQLNQYVVGIDNLSTGHLRNISVALSHKNFSFYEADIVDAEACQKIFTKYHIDFVLHHAALSSVPFSMKNPEIVNLNNIEGFNNIIELSKQNEVKAFIYASSSSVYGDNADAVKTEAKLGQLLSPYAASKYANEITASEFAKSCTMHITGLRYFNVYGKRQDPNGAYAAVIPKWTNAILANDPVRINGDGSTTRDFCNVEDVVQANILACYKSISCKKSSQQALIYNIGTGKSQSLNFLLQTIIRVASHYGITYNLKPEYGDFIEGDIKHSCASIQLAQNNLSFNPSNDLEEGISKLIKWSIYNEQCLSA